MKTFIITVCIILGVVFLLLKFAPTWETPNVESAGVSSTTDWYDDHTRIIRKDGCEYVIFAASEAGGITHHGACDNPNCIYKK